MRGQHGSSKVLHNVRGSVLGQTGQLQTDVGLVKCLYILFLL